MVCKNGCNYGVVHVYKSKVMYQCRGKCKEIIYKERHKEEIFRKMNRK